jgi:hypothetical protein
MEPTERRTFSLWGTAYALTQNVKLLRVAREPGQKAVFILDDTGDRASAALDAWWNSEPLVNGRALIAARAVLLDEITNIK